MTGRPVVFLGPSLPRETAVALLDAVYLPPADQGAVVAAVHDHAPSAIGIVDGAFGTVPAVRHKDILWALAQGVTVLGAASMGALRAAELHGAGMIGVGLIYRWYRRSVLVDDDEVAVAMAPDALGAGALSEALINIRVTLRRAERAGVISPDQRHALVRAARRRHFASRSYAAAIDDVEPGQGGSVRLAALRDWLPSGRVDQKADDARALLRCMADGLAGRTDRQPGRPVVAPMPVTEIWLWDLYQASRAHPAVSRTLPSNFLDALTKNAG